MNLFPGTGYSLALAAIAVASTSCHAAAIADDHPLLTPDREAAEKLGFTRQVCSFGYNLFPNYTGPWRMLSLWEKTFPAADPSAPRRKAFVLLDSKPVYDKQLIDRVGTETWVRWVRFDAQPAGEEWSWDIAFYPEEKRIFLVRLAADRSRRTARIAVHQTIRDNDEGLKDLHFDRFPEAEADWGAGPWMVRDFEIPSLSAKDPKTGDDRGMYFDLRATCVGEGLLMSCPHTEADQTLLTRFHFATNKWRRLRIVDKPGEGKGAEPKK